MLTEDDTPEPGHLPDVYPRNPPRNLLRGSLLKPSNFYSIEGLEGAGKSTIVRAVVQELESRKRKTVVAKLRSSAISDHALERAKWENSDPFIFNLINWVGLFDQVSELANLLNGDQIILFDRYATSIQVRGMLEGMTDELMKVLEPRLPKPRKLFYVDCDPEVCLQRIKSGGRVITYYESGVRDVQELDAPMTEPDESVRHRDYDRSGALLRHLRSMQAMYRRVLSERDNVVMIDNSGSLESSVSTIIANLD